MIVTRPGGVTPRSREGFALLSSSNNLFRRGVPPHGRLAAVGGDRHLAGDRGTEAELERTDGLLAAAHTIEEVLHVQTRHLFVTPVVGDRLRRDLLPLRDDVNLIRVGVNQGRLGAEQVIVPFPVVVVAEHRGEREKSFSGWLIETWKVSGMSILGAR